MKSASLVLPLAALALAAPAVHAETGPRPKEARIPFADNGGIRDWRSGDRDTLYIQGRDRTWYKVELMGSATDLPYAWTIGFDTGPSGTLDKFSSIVVRGQRYAIQSLVEIEGEPPKKAERGEA